MRRLWRQTALVSVSVLLWIFFFSMGLPFVPDGVWVNLTIRLAKPTLEKYLVSFARESVPVYFSLFIGFNGYANKVARRVGAIFCDTLRERINIYPFGFGSGLVHLSVNTLHLLVLLCPLVLRPAPRK